MKSLGVLPALSSFNLEEMSHGKYGFRSLIDVQQITYCLVPWETVNFVFPQVLISVINNNFSKVTMARIIVKKFQLRKERLDVQNP